MSNAYDMAFPVLDRSQTPNDTTQLGLTKREYFAAMALQGLMGRRWERPGVSDDEIIAAWGESAVACADALIDALNKPVQS